MDWCNVAFAAFGRKKPAATANVHSLNHHPLFLKSLDDEFEANTMAADDYEIGNMGLAAIHRGWQRVCAITLDETPSGVAEMHARANAPPISHVVSELEARRPVRYAQHKTAIWACYRLGRKPLSLPHTRNPRQHHTTPKRPKGSSIR
jgi:hypothetical protein